MPSQFDIKETSLGGIMFILLIQVVFSLSALAAQQCPYNQSISNEAVANRFYTVSMGCLVSVTPLHKPDLVYREYYFDERGRFLVFDSVAGPAETATGYKSYFLFPRKNEPNFDVQANGNISVLLANGEKADFSSSSSRIIQIAGGEFSESANPQIHEQAFELKSYRGIWLRSGWAMGKAAYLDAERNSTFADQDGHTCEVKNTEIFDYVNMIYSEPVFYFQSDLKLAEFLKSRCPTIETSSLFGVN